MKLVVAGACSALLAAALPGCGHFYVPFSAIDAGGRPVPEASYLVQADTRRIAEVRARAVGVPDSCVENASADLVAAGFHAWNWGPGVLEIPLAEATLETDDGTSIPALRTSANGQACPTLTVPEGGEADGEVWFNLGAPGTFPRIGSFRLHWTTRRPDESTPRETKFVKVLPRLFVRGYYGPPGYVYPPPPPGWYD